MAKKDAKSEIKFLKAKKKQTHKENVKVCVSCASPPVEKRQQINKIVKAKSSESLEKVGFEAWIFMCALK